MPKDTLLVVLTVAGSALCWWPWIIEPSLDLPDWLPFVIVALLTGLSSTLSGGRWLSFLVASSVGTFVGLWGGYAIWWPKMDPIARPWFPILSLVATLAAMVVSLFAGLVIRRVRAKREKGRLALWIGVACCVAFGPVALSLTPPLVARRITRNERAAFVRIESLRNAVEQTIADNGNPESVCDVQALRRHYSGPQFSEDDWRYIAGNYVKQDGYVFGIYCHEKSGYTIHAMPKRGEADGTRAFCTDQSGKVGCGMEGNAFRHACTACTK